MMNIKERFLDVVNPRRWEQHMTEEVQQKWNGKNKSALHPINLIPTAIKYPLILADALYQNKHKPPMISAPRGLKINSISMPPKGKSKKKMPFRKVQTMVVAVPKKKAKKPYVQKRRGNTVMLIGRNNVGGGRKQNGYTPPLTKMYSQSSSSPKFGFRAGSREGCLIVTGTQRLGQIGVSNLLAPYQTLSPSTQTGFALFLDSTLGDNPTGSFDTVVPLNPALMAYFGFPVSQFAGVFSKFRYLNANFRFKTSSPSSSAGKLMLAYTEDPEYMETQGAGRTDPHPFIAWQQGDLACLAHETSSAVWNNFSFKIPLSKERSKQFYYSNMPGHSNILNNERYYFGVPNDVATDRQSLQGILYIGGDTTGVPNTRMIGDLFFDYSIEFCDIVKPAIYSVEPPDEVLTVFERNVMKAVKKIGLKEHKEKIRSEGEEHPVEPGLPVFDKF